MSTPDLRDRLQASFFHDAPLLACLADTEGRFLALGGPWTSTLGWTREELLAERFLTLVHPDDLEATLAENARLASGDPTIRFRNRYRTRDGAWRMLQWDAHRSSEGVVIAMALDVTESVQRDASLAQRTAVLELVADLQRAYIREGWAGLSFGELSERMRALVGAEFALVARVAHRPDRVAHLEPIAASSAPGAAAWRRLPPAWLEETDAPWTEVLHGGRPVLRHGADALAALPVRIHAFLGLPVHAAGEVVAVLALFNRPGGFDEGCVAVLSPLSGALGPMYALERERARASLLEGEVHRWSDLFAAVIASTGVAVIATDPHGAITYANPTALGILGAPSPESCVGTNLAGVVDADAVARARQAHPDARTDFHALVAAAESGGRQAWAYVSLSGARSPMRVTLSALRSRDGARCGWVAVAAEGAERDAVATERARAAALEQQIEVLRRREQQATRISEAYAYVAASRTIREALSVIAAFLPAIFGEAAPCLLVARRSGGSAEPDEPAVEAGSAVIEPTSCWSVKTGQVFVSDSAALRCAHLPAAGTFACAPVVDGVTTAAVLCTSLPAPADADDERARVLASLADQSRQFSSVLSNVRLRRQLEEQATRDPLTGAVNRRMLDQELRVTLARHAKTGTEFAIAIADVDHFKRINDTWGHDRGDQVLQGLARVLRARLRATDVLARIGGEEFVLVLRNVSAADALQCAEELCALVEQAELAGPERSCTCSIGLVHVARDGATDALLLRADRALYRAKAEGRNRVCVAGPEDLAAVRALNGGAP
jgi:diguanylate cyclase (GGDEF)-like protein/PAS domain S-box-containing protein